MMTSNSFWKAITAVRTNVANLSDAALWKIKRARFARNRQKSVRSLRDSVKGPVESKRALSLPETLTSKIRWVSPSVLPFNLFNVFLRLACLVECSLRVAYLVNWAHSAGLGFRFPRGSPQGMSMPWVAFFPFVAQAKPWSCSGLFWNGEGSKSTDSWPEM